MTHSEILAAARGGIARVKAERGRTAARRQWDRLCGDQAEAARTVRTARDVLRDPRARKLVYEIVRDGRQYSSDLDYYATRRVIAEARSIIAERVSRRDQDAPVPQPGRIAALATPAEIARRIVTGRHQRTYLRRQLLRPEVRQHLTPRQIADLSRQCHLGTRQRAEIAREVAGRPCDAAVRIVAEQIGEIGDQAERDLRELAESESLSGKQGRNHYYERSVVDRIQLNSGCTAALVTIADIRSWGGRGYGGADGYGKQSGVGYRVYLIVRDATRGSAHILRVPPKYGNPRTQFFGRFRTADERIEAAREWTFGERSLAGAIEV